MATLFFDDLNFLLKGNKFEKNPPKWFAGSVQEMVKYLLGLLFVRNNFFLVFSIKNRGEGSKWQKTECLKK